MPPLLRPQYVIVAKDELFFIQSLHAGLRNSARHRRNLTVSSNRNHSGASRVPKCVRRDGLPTTRDWQTHRVDLERILRRHLFYVPSFEIYQGISDTDSRGLYDHGPLGCALQRNLVELWRKHFVVEEDMLEIDTPSLTPREVLETSGHVDKFVDWVCQDAESGRSFRADHLLKDTLQARLDECSSKIMSESKLKDQSDGMTVHQINKSREYRKILAKVDNLPGEEIGRIIKEQGIRSPETGNVLEEPSPFNLMFHTSLGPSITTSSTAYLRPETAQSQFVNFQKLLSYEHNKLPFASASVGKAYRNEITPRNGLLRLREFLIAEVEHYVHPKGRKQHPKFSEIANVELPLLSQMADSDGHEMVVNTKVGAAVAQGLIADETIGYFLARTYQFLSRLGVNQQMLRFRRHLPNEMAHYASSCWDAELFTSYGWVECVGIADRAAYDLNAHSKRTGESLTVREPLPKPETRQEWRVDAHPKAFGLTFRKNGEALLKYLQSLSQVTLKNLAADLAHRKEIKLIAPTNNEGDHVTLTNNHISITEHQITVTHNTYTPHVIEPSFGLTRLLYCTLEHTFHSRPATPSSMSTPNENQDSSSAKATRPLLSLPPSLAPTKVVLTSLSPASDFAHITQRLRTRFKAASIAVKLDASSASIGKHYARADEVGTAFAVTADFRSLTDGTVTLRERDSMEQVRLKEEEVVGVVRELCEELCEWGDVKQRFEGFVAQKGEEG